MTRVVEVPSHFDHRSFDQFARACAVPGETRLLFDAHATTWASPYALVGLLVAGQSVVEGGAEIPLLAIPQDRDVAHYWARAGFFDQAQAWFEIHGKVPRVVPTGTSDVLLEITAIRGTDDVHGVVEIVQERSQAILTHELNLDAAATMGFAMALSEACQNIVEHAGTSGWVAVQSYNWRRRLGRNVVVIGVADSGVGFRRSLEATQAARFGDRWGDATALEAAVFQGASRFRDPGRGQGLAGVTRYLNRWSGKLSVRSGTARLSIVPPWDDDRPLAADLPAFPGSQLLIIVPAQADE
ncbi:MAG: ATP-binding protein [Gemmatimonadales bacterium]